MDDTLLFIPPCCVDRKLPKAVMEAPGRSLTFYTHGDVTMEKFYRAVSYLVADTPVMVVSMAVASMDTLTFLNQCFEREWITHLVLSTRLNCRELIQRFLPRYPDKILYACAKDVSEVSSHMVLYSDKQILSLEGPMLERADNMHLTCYHLSFTPSRINAYNANDWGNPLRNVLLPDVLRHRASTRSSRNRNRDAVLYNFLDCKFVPSQEARSDAPKDHYMFNDY